MGAVGLGQRFSFAPQRAMYVPGFASTSAEMIASSSFARRQQDAVERNYGGPARSTNCRN